MRDSKVCSLSQGQPVCGSRRRVIISWSLSIPVILKNSLGSAFFAGIGLTDFLKHLTERSLAHVERLTALDTREFARADDGGRILVGTDNAALSVERALDGLTGTLLDKLKILLVRSRRAGEVAGLEDLNLLGAEKLAETLAYVLADVDLVETRMTESVAGWIREYRFFTGGGITFLRT